MLTVSQCRKILGTAATDMTDDQVRALRDLLYTIGTFDFHHFQEHHTDENCSDIHPRLDRRTGEDGNEP